MKNIFIKYIIISFFIMLAVNMGFSTPISLQLKWLPSWQFAGYYMAEKKGYFTEKGLKVSLRHISDISHYQDHSSSHWYFNALEKEALDFAVTDTSYLFYPFKEYPKVVAAFMQHNPIAFITRKESGISSLDDLIGKDIILYSSETLELLLKKEKVFDSVNIVYHTGTLNLFMKKEIDVMTGYISSSPFFLDEYHIDYNIIAPSHYGIDLYGDILIVVNKDLDKQTIYDFREACIKGWEYALKNPDEVIDYIHSTYPERARTFYEVLEFTHDRFSNPDDLFNKYLIYESRSITSLFSFPIIKTGENNPSRWQKILDLYKSEGMLTKSLTTDDILWDYKKVENHIWLKRFLIFLILSVILIVLLIVWNITLKKTIDKRVLEIRKKDEENILFYKTIINSSPSAMYVTDKDFFVQMVNENGQRLIGQPVENKKIFDLIPSLKDLVKNTEGEMQIFNTGHYLFQKEIQLVDMKSYDIKVYPFSTLEQSGFVFSLADISEKKYLEQQLIQAQKMETVGTLAGGLAHDFNNVLSGVIGPISMLQSLLERDKINNPSFQKYLSTIENSANKASLMVQNLLSISRKQNFKFGPVDLNLSVRNVIQICKSTLNKSIILNPIYYKSKAIIKADSNHIEQALLNLSLNAAHAMTIMKPENMKQGGILEITIDKTSATTLKQKKGFKKVADHYYVVSVKDNGVGINKDSQSLIFDPFFTTKEKNQGTGLGLSMTYNIIKQHKGYIDVESEEGKGSIFHIYLPEYHIESEESELITEKKTFKFKGTGSVLVIDDEEIVREMASDMLKTLGFNVLTAENGQKGLEIFREHKDSIKLIIMDLEMPVMTGLECFPELLKIDKNIKVFLSSGFRKDERVESLMQAGIYGFIQKPYSLKDMLEKISSVFNNKN